MPRRTAGKQRFNTSASHGIAHDGIELVDIPIPKKKKITSAVPTGKKISIREAIVKEKRAGQFRWLTSFCGYILESPLLIALLALFTIWALFNDDIRLATAPKEADYTFLVIISIIFFVFVMEIVMASIYSSEYLGIPDWSPKRDDETWNKFGTRVITVGSFYFWLDIVATLSLLFEVRIKVLNYCLTFSLLFSSRLSSPLISSSLLSSLSFLTISSLSLSFALLYFAHMCTTPYHTSPHHTTPHHTTPHLAEFNFFTLYYSNPKR